MFLDGFPKPHNINTRCQEEEVTTNTAWAFMISLLLRSCSFTFCHGGYGGGGHFWILTFILHPICLTYLGALQYNVSKFFKMLSPPCIRTYFDPLTHPNFAVIITWTVGGLLNNIHISSLMPQFFALRSKYLGSKKFLLEKNWFHVWQWFPIICCGISGKDVASPTMCSLVWWWLCGVVWCMVSCVANSWVGTLLAATPV